MNNTTYINELIEFLETENFAPVFWDAKYLGWITQEERDQSFRITGEEWFALRDGLLMFILLAEGVEF